MTDEELIARLRKADEYEPLGHDGWEAADRIEALVKARREDALELLAAHGQAQDAYEAQLKAEAQNAALTARVEGLTGALEKAYEALLWCARDGRMASPLLHQYPAKWAEDARAALSATTETSQ